MSGTSGVQLQAEGRWSDGDFIDGYEHRSLEALLEQAEFGEVLKGTTHSQQIPRVGEEHDLVGAGDERSGSDLTVRREVFLAVGADLINDTHVIHSELAEELDKRRIRLIIAGQGAGRCKQPGPVVPYRLAFGPGAIVEN